MGLICILGGHNWEEVGSIKKRFAINDLLQSRFRKAALRELDKRKAFLKNFIPSDHLEQYLSQYICLRCCAVKDGVRDYLDRCEAVGYRELEEERRLVRRQEKANYLLKNCAKNKFKKIYRKEK